MLPDLTARFLVDAQLPPALVRWLSGQGYEAAHVFDLGLAGADDRLIWKRAADTGAVIITKDEDFALRRTLEDIGPAVVWLRLGNTRKAALFFAGSSPSCRMYWSRWSEVKRLSRLPEL